MSATFVYANVNANDLHLNLAYFSLHSEATLSN